MSAMFLSISIFFAAVVLCYCAYSAHWLQRKIQAPGFHESGFTYARCRDQVGWLGHDTENGD